MVKIGPAFSDYVREGKPYRRRDFGSLIPQELLFLLPLLLLILIFTVMAFRIFYIQILRADYYKGLSDSNRTRTEAIAAERGVILDRAGRPLVSNSAVATIKEGDKTKVISRSEALKIVSKNKTVDDVILREYLYKNAFSHVLGYVGKMSSDEVILPEYSSYGISDFIGKMGLERQYEKYLHGTNGKRIFEVDATGKFIRELGREEPIAGRALHTTLDLKVQLAVEKAFKNTKRGAAVVSDPTTGEILAIYSSPSFDPNIFTRTSLESETSEDSDKIVKILETAPTEENVSETEADEEQSIKYDNVESILGDSFNQPLMDRAISGAYPPGSTFKLVTAIAALENKAIKPDTKIEDTGVLKVGDFSFGNWYFLQHGRTDGIVDMVKAIARSNDIFFYKAAEAAGVDQISAFSKNVGLGKRLGIDLPGEVPGTVPTKEWKEEVIGEQWYLGDTYNYGIGQGYLLSTPLQVNFFTNIFANGGTLYKPHLVEGNKKVLKDKFLNKEYISLIARGMEESCETGGVAFPFFDFKVKNSNLKLDNNDFTRDASAGAEMVRVKVGCKTGTAETGGEHTKPHSWITVFAPFHKPEVTVTVLVENGGEGSAVAGPIARDILKDYFEKK